MVYFHANVIDKPYCESEPNQAADYAVNPGLIMSKTSVNNGRFNIVAYAAKQQTMGYVDNCCYQI